MNKITTKKVLRLLQHISKSQIANILQISRSHLYDLIETHKWKNHHIGIIDNIYNKVSICDDITKITVENGDLCIYSIGKTPVTKLIYPL